MWDPGTYCSCEPAGSADSPSSDRLTLGEIFLLDELAADCEADGVWEFFLSAAPLKVKGGVGAPITPIAMK